ncbi:hypothetical protein [Paenibacillus soyae]|uniref:Uncharacterized protein n=1 Tax=Paenibacillus soyae TaxID=2969249 RepID=A0A9X2MSW9_9BACL|nr:hypothetical protein [Paenibacillus soyae]MCR2803142.1 hypothetical protein [Paenibacillus soyae]
MFWTAVWFVVNMLFVAALIVCLFMQRAVTIGKLQEVSAERMAVLTRRRNVLAAVSVLLFAGMCAAFVVNMKLNG